MSDSSTQPIDICTYCTRTNKQKRTLCKGARDLVDAAICGDDLCMKELSAANWAGRSQHYIMLHRHSHLSEMQRKCSIGPGSIFSQKLP